MLTRGYTSDQIADERSPKCTRCSSVLKIVFNSLYTLVSGHKNMVFHPRGKPDITLLLSESGRARRVHVRARVREGGGHSATVFPPWCHDAD